MPSVGDSTIQDIYAALATDEVRNRAIVSDIGRAMEHRRLPTC